MDVCDFHFEAGLDVCYSHLKVGLDACNPRLKVGLDGFEIGFGGEVGIKELDLFVGEGLGLAFGESAGGEVSDKSVGVEDDGFVHGTMSLSRWAKRAKHRPSFLVGSRGWGVVLCFRKDGVGVGGGSRFNARQGIVDANYYVIHRASGVGGVGAGGAAGSRGGVVRGGLDRRPLRIGLLLNSSGTSGAAVERQQSFELAMKHVNEGGGVLGRPVEWVVVETTLDPESCGVGGPAAGR